MYAVFEFYAIFSPKRAILGQNWGPCSEYVSGTPKNEFFTTSYLGMTIFRALSLL